MARISPIVRSATGAALASIWILSGCGYIPTDQHRADDAASGARSVASGVRSPWPRPSLSPLPTPTGTNPKFAAGDCVAAPVGQRIEPVTGDGASVQVPPGWADISNTLRGEEGPYLFLAAPADYGSHTVKIAWGSLLGPRPGSSSRQQLQDYADNAVKPVNNATVIVSPTDCTVAGEKASFLELSYGSTVEYRVYVMHHPDQSYPYVWYTIVSGTGGVDDRSLLDAKRLMGSWTWEQ